MDTYLFDDRDSVVHFVLGLLCALLPALISVPMAMAFLVYEVREPENPVSTVGDVVEFLFGFAVGVMLRGGASI